MTNKIWIPKNITKVIYADINVEINFNTKWSIKNLVKLKNKLYIHIFTKIRNCVIGSWKTNDSKCMKINI